LQKDSSDGAIPVIGDANSLTYVLHLKVGQDWILEREGADPLHLRIVGALADSLFQRELLMSESNFKRLFPDMEGYRFFLLEVPKARAAEIGQSLEERLADYGFDVLSTAEQLASFHRVENTYLSTFQALGGLGLILGTVGLAIVLLRNVLERRRELALLRVVGYTRRHLTIMILAENVLLLLCGLTTGSLCAFLAVAPALSARGGALPAVSLSGLLLAVLLAGLGASILATRAALRTPLLEALRAE
jgi:putative ABC transport system permease protein